MVALVQTSALRCHFPCLFTSSSCSLTLHALSFLAIVEPGHRAFKFNKFSGVQDSIMREGWHFKMPYFERQIIYDVRSHPQTISSRTGSKGTSCCSFAT